MVARDDVADEVARRLHEEAEEAGHGDAAVLDLGVAQVADRRLVAEAPEVEVGAASGSQMPSKGRAVGFSAQRRSRSALVSWTLTVARGAAGATSAEAPLRARAATIFCICDGVGCGDCHALCASVSSASALTQRRLGPPPKNGRARLVPPFASLRRPEPCCQRSRHVASSWRVDDAQRGAETGCVGSLFLRISMTATEAQRQLGFTVRLSSVKQRKICHSIPLTRRNLRPSYTLCGLPKALYVITCSTKARDCRLSAADRDGETLEGACRESKEHKRKRLYVQRGLCTIQPKGPRPEQRSRLIGPFAPSGAAGLDALPIARPSQNTKSSMCQRPGVRTRMRHAIRSSKGTR